jgi:hypothetical protein
VRELLSDAGLLVWDFGSAAARQHVSAWTPGKRLPAFLSWSLWRENICAELSTRPKDRFGRRDRLLTVRAAGCARGCRFVWCERERSENGDQGRLDAE